MVIIGQEWSFDAPSRLALEVSQLKYGDCCLVLVPLANMPAYQQMAMLSAEVVKDHGAPRTMERWLDEGCPEASTYHGETAHRAELQYSSFSKAAGVGDGETLVM